MTANLSLREQAAQALHAARITRGTCSDDWHHWSVHLDEAAAVEAVYSAARLRAVPDRPVIVTIYSDGDTNIDAPDGVQVEIRYEDLPTDVPCSCGIPLYRDDDGALVHRDGYGYGDDHDPNPIVT